MNTFCKLPGVDAWLVSTAAADASGQTVDVTRARGATRTVTLGKFVATVKDRHLYEIAPKSAPALPVAAPPPAIAPAADSGAAEVLAALKALRHWLKTATNADTSPNGPRELLAAADAALAKAGGAAP